MRGESRNVCDGGNVTMTSIGRPLVAALATALLLASAGCERSQPGPKPISGDSAPVSGTGKQAPQATVPGEKAK